MSKVKYIIEVDKDDIDVFLTKMNERYIINQYDGEECVCGRVLLSAFRTATPLTESDDCVSRQALLRKLNRETHEFNNGLGYRKEWVDIARSLPPVFPKREQGEWIVKMDCEGKTRTCICSKCGEKTGKYTWKNPNYCPNCGAEMR